MVDGGRSPIARSFRIWLAERLIDGGYPGLRLRGLVIGQPATALTKRPLLHTGEVPARSLRFSLSRCPQSCYEVGMGPSLLRDRQAGRRGPVSR